MSEPRPRELEEIAVAVTRPRGRDGGRNFADPISRQRFIRTQRERAMVKAWRACPEALGYLRGVVVGTEAFDPGRFKAASLILSKTMPSVTAQAVLSEATTLHVDGRDRDLTLRARFEAVGLEFPGDHLGSGG